MYSNRELLVSEATALPTPPIDASSLHLSC